MATGDEQEHTDLILSESQVRQIIERAVKNDPKSTGISVAELQRIAEELDIDRIALNRALDEVLAQPPAGIDTRTLVKRLVDGLSLLLDDVLPRRARLLSGVAFGASVGWVSGAFSPGSELDVPVGIAMVALTFANSISRKLGHRFRAFVAETAGMWGAFAATWAATYGSVTDDLLAWVGLNTIVSLAWGWFLIRRSPNDVAPSERPDVPSLPAQPAGRDARKPQARDRHRPLPLDLIMEFVLLHPRRADQLAVKTTQLERT